MEIKFYSSHCPKCKILEQLMDQKQMEYQLIDDEQIYMPIADENNILSMPFAEIDGIIYKTKALQQFINNQ